MYKYGRLQARREITPKTVMQRAMFQLVLLSLLFWLAIFSTVLRPVQAVNLADIESQMVDGDGIPLRGSNGGLAAKKPFMLYPQLLDDLLDGKSTTPSSRKN